MRFCEQGSSTYSVAIACAYQRIHEPKLLLNGVLVLAKSPIVLYLEEVAYEALGTHGIGAWSEWEKEEGHI